MRLKKTFTIPVSEPTARQRVMSYFAEAGYQVTEGEGRILSFKRGSRMGSWFPLNPANLLSLAEIEIIPKGNNVDIKADFDVKATFKDESHFTDEFWANEIKELEIALFKGEYSPVKAKNLTARALMANLRSLFAPVVYIFLWGLLALLLTLAIINIPGIETVEPLLVAFGAMAVSAVAAVFIVRAWKKRRRG